MKKFTLYILIVLLYPVVLNAQNSTTPEKVSLQYCIQQAIKNFPVQKQLQLNQSKYKLEQENTKKNYLPTLDLNGMASYQSDVTKVPLPPTLGFSIPEISKDWYKVNLDLEQFIWDGGMTKNQKVLQTADYKIADQQVKVKTFTLKKQVDILYFNILFSQTSLDALHVLIKDLDARIKDAETAMQNGTLLPADVDALKVNKKLAQQQIIEKSEEQKGLIGSLNQLTGLNIQSAKQLIVPKANITSYTFVNNRPEYKLLELQKNKISALEKMSTVKRMPKIKLFGQAGYGRPGYDMLDDDFKTYYKVGVSLHWNIFDWNRVKNEKQILTIQSDIIKTEQENFNQSLRAELKKQLASIQKVEKLIQTDKDILQLQKNVVAAANNKLKNGTITATTYLIELNKEIKAQLTMEAHKIQLEFAKYQYLTTLGNL
ncbi:TolC family protein [Candidatus Sulfidibacterium hydrothermale]|uniref:TolC family protein n=1 Tax=Candidatus Sulfidibacterium hydrothermale TaxID=2875962 RepID=UPI001F0A1243|nr:TolC family protein [Candidatus Sulfidibacterium hydrothermale]UBM62297.1 TolC family protein [Candidatus Sulfidibacterium hydrothermale]